MRTSSITLIQNSAQLKTFVKNLALAFSFAALTAISAHVKIPVPGTPVPVTLQTAVVLLSGMVLGAGWGFTSMALYLLGGSLGLSFFAFSSGPAALVGPTGGYLWGFLLAAFAIGKIVKPQHGFLRVYFTTFLASLLIFIPGVLQLKAFMGFSLSAAILAGFVPFILGDLIKVGITTASYKGLKNLVLT